MTVSTTDRDRASDLLHRTDVSSTHVHANHKGEEVPMMNRMRLRSTLGLAMIGMAGLAAYLLYAFAPWHLDRYDFLIRPLLDFSLPLSLFGMLMLVASQRLTINPWSLLVVILPGLLVLFLLQRWPASASMTQWEDSYQLLAVINTVIRYWCWLCWISYSGYLLWGLHRTASTASP